MKKKIVAMCATVALAAVAVGGTLAYFTAEDEATNVFTVGNVDIDLIEPAWEASGNEDAPEVYPGEPLAKDPQVENIGQNPCFVRVKVEGLDSLGNAGMIGLRYEYVDGYNTADWTLHTDGYYYYNEPLCVAGTEGESWNAGLAAATTPLFDQIVMPYGLENGDGETEYEVEIFAEAIQAQGAQPSWSAVKEMSVADIAGWFGNYSA